MGKATICLFTVAGLILVTAALPQARAVATMTPVTFTDFTPPQTPTFERRWIDDQNVFHVRGLTVFGQVSGDISGTFKARVAGGSRGRRLCLPRPNTPNLPPGTG